MKSVRILVVLALTLISTDAIDSKNTTDDIPITQSNGCILTKTSSDDNPHRWTSFPQLNCSNLGWTTLDQTDVPSDVASIILSYNKLTSLNIDDFANFTKLISLDLKHNEITELVPSALKPPTTLVCRRVSLSYNKLEKIPTEAFRNFPSLSSLDISGNQIKTVGDNDFETVPKLTLLAIGSNPLEKISTVAWKNLTSTLYALTMRFTGITEVPEFVSKMSKLMYMSLSNNEISNIQANSFSKAKSLRWLELAGNKIRRLDQNAFHGMANLKYLDLTDNLLETLPPDVFKSMHDENQLSVELYENPIRCDCNMAWLKRWTDSLHFQDIRYKCAQPKRHHGKKAYEINIEDFTCRPGDVDWNETCVETIKPNTVSTTVKPNSQTPVRENNICPDKCKCFDSKGVQYHPTPSGNEKSKFRLWWMKQASYPQVDCNKVGLTELPKNIRTDVKALSLADNEIKTINIKDLKQFPSLQRLILNGNGLKSFKPDPTTEFKNLTELFVHHNNLTSFGRMHLKSFPSLTTLRMFNNRITTIPNNIFQFNRELHRIYIGPNPVEKFNARCLDGLDIYSLSLRNMSLTQMPKIKSRNLTYFEISDNKITIIPNNTFADMPILYRLVMDNNLISTIGVSAFNGTSKLRTLDLSENKLTTLPRGIFDDLNTERLQIELWKNRMTCDCNLKWFKQWIEKIEADDPMTEVRFMCLFPMRLHGKPSNALGPDDFACTEDEKKYTSEKDVENAIYVSEHGRCYTQGQMALAVLLTIMFMSAIILVVKCCVNRKKRAYARYKPHHESNSQLDLDMQ